MSAITEQQFAAGREKGYAAGKHDLAEGLSTHHDQESFYRAMGERDVHGENVRAWYLGLARGYREAVRSFKWGRWGT